MGKEGDFKKKLPIILAVVFGMIITVGAFFFMGGATGVNQEGVVVNNEGNYNEGSSGREESVGDDEVGDDAGIVESVTAAVSSVFGGGSSAGGGGGGGGSGGGGSSGESGGEESGGEQDPPLTCNDVQYAYALKDFNNTVGCQAYVNLECVEMYANCSMVIENLDIGSPPATFEFLRELRDKDTDEVLESDSFSGTLSYQNPVVFESIFSIQDSGGISENLECVFRSVNIPRKEVCN